MGVGQVHVRWGKLPRRVVVEEASKKIDNQVKLVDFSTGKVVTEKSNEDIVREVAKAFKAGFQLP